MKNKSVLNFFIFIAIFPFFVFGCGDAIPKRVLNRQIQQIGSRGSEPGQFLEPRGLCYTPAGNFLVTDFRNFRIQELKTDGSPVQQWGGKGNGPGQLNDPTCAAMDSQGNLYVVDTWNHRIQKYDTSGTWTPEWAQGGGFYAPRGIAIDQHDRVYIANTSFHEIKVFNPDGTLAFTWGNHSASPETFHDPVGLTFGPEGNLYVADTGNHRVKIIDTTGATIKTLPVTEWKKETFNEAYIAVGSDGKIYITSPLTNTIGVYMSDGEAYSRFGEPGSGPEQLNFPIGIVVDKENNIFISDCLNHRIVKYAPAPAIPKPTHAPPSPQDRLISISRIIIDLIALFIIIRWVLTKFILRTMTPVETRKYHLYPALKSRLARDSGLSYILMIFGIILLTCAIISFSRNRPSLGSLLMLSGIGLSFIAGIPFSFSRMILHHLPPMNKHLRMISFGILILVTVGLRLYKLDEIPWGINNDAAWNGIYAQRILNGEPYTPFTTECWGKSTLYMYLVALTFKCFGVGRYILYIPCITAGILGVVFLFFLFQHLFGTRFAMIASFIYSDLAWMITFGRTGYRAILAPLCLALTCWLYYQAVDASSWWKRQLYYMGSGLFIGIGLQTYFSFRGIPLLMIVVGIHTWITKKKFMRQNWWGLSALFIVSVAAYMPTIIYASQFWHPGEPLQNNISHILESPLMGRQNALFVGSKIKSAGSLEPLFHNISRNLLIYHYQARVGNFFNNEWPILSRPAGLFLAMGFGVFLRALFKRGSILVILIFCFGTLPSILSEPDATRLIMVPMALAAFIGAGITSACHLIPASYFERWYAPLSILLVFWVMASEFQLYFHKMGNDYYAQYGYALKHTLIGEKGLELSRNNHLYISQGHFIDTPKFICYGVPGNVFSITDGEVIDFISTERLLDNLDRVLSQPHEPGKGLAFVFENDPKNVPLIRKVRTRYPKGIYEVFYDNRLTTDPIFFTVVIPEDQLEAPIIPDLSMESETQRES